MTQNNGTYIRQLKALICFFYVKLLILCGLSLLIAIMLQSLTPLQFLKFITFAIAIEIYHFFQHENISLGNFTLRTIEMKIINEHHWRTTEHLEWMSKDATYLTLEWQFAKEKDLRFPMLLTEPDMSDKLMADLLPQMDFRSMKNLSATFWIRFNTSWASFISFASCRRLFRWRLLFAKKICE